jgi:hypothetical protein
MKTPNAKTELIFPVWLRIHLPTAEAALIEGQPEVLLSELYPEQHTTYVAYRQDLELKRAQRARREAINRQLKIYQVEEAKMKQPRGAAFGIKSKSAEELGSIMHAAIEQHVFSIFS